MAAKRIALAIISRNAERFMAEQLPELTKQFGEVVIGVDESSVDNTLQAASRPGVKTYTFTHDEFAGPARNRGLELVESPWVFALDTDEAFSPELFQWLSDFEPGSACAMLITRHNLIDGQEIGSNTFEPHVRLFRSNLRFVRRLHEQVVVVGACGRAPAEALLLHYKTSLQQHRSNVLYSTYSFEEQPVEQTEPVRLHLGSGSVRLEGFLNVDALDLPEVDLVWNFTPRMNWDEHLSPYPGHLPWRDETVDEIVARHVIEHFSYHHASDVLKDWMRMLKPGGRIEVATPDLGQIITDAYKGGLNYLRTIQLLFAGQTTPYNYHFNAIDEPWLTGQLFANGAKRFKRMRPLEPYELRMEAWK